MMYKLGTSGSILNCRKDECENETGNETCTYAFLRSAMAAHSGKITLLPAGTSLTLLLLLLFLLILVLFLLLLILVEVEVVIKLFDLYWAAIPIALPMLNDDTTKVTGTFSSYKHTS